MPTKKNSKTITLSRPFKRGDKTIKEVTVSEPKDAGALRGLKLSAIAEMDVNTLFTYLPRVTTPKLTQPEVESLSAMDFATLGGTAVNFLIE